MIKGNVVGGAGLNSGAVFTVGTPNVTLGGSLVGGSGEDSGMIQGLDNLGVQIAGDVRGWAGLFSGQILGRGTITKLAIGGSVSGGNSGTATFFTNDNGIKVFISTGDILTL